MMNVNTSVCSRVCVQHVYVLWEFVTCNMSKLRCILAQIGRIILNLCICDYSTTTHVFLNVFGCAIGLQQYVWNITYFEGRRLAE